MLLPAFFILGFSNNSILSATVNLPFLNFASRSPNPASSAVSRGLTNFYNSSTALTLCAGSAIEKTAPSRSRLCHQNIAAARLQPRQKHHERLDHSEPLVCSTPYGSRITAGFGGKLKGPQVGRRAFRRV